MERDDGGRLDPLDRWDRAVDRCNRLTRDRFLRLRRECRRAGHGAWLPTSIRGVLVCEECCEYAGDPT